jgi:hypothetical protein
MIESPIITKDGFSEEIKEPVDILNEVSFGPFEPDFEVICYIVYFQSRSR